MPFKEIAAGRVKKIKKLAGQIFITVTCLQVEVLLLCLFRDRVSLCSLGWPTGTHDLPASALGVLGLQACPNPSCSSKPASLTQGNSKSDFFFFNSISLQANIIQPFGGSLIGSNSELVIGNH
jgi:hypothetical protein